MRTRCPALLCLSLLMAGCQAKAPSHSLIVEFHPYDFHEATPRKLEALLERMDEESKEGDRARYLVSQVRLDWFLTAWLTRDRALLGSLGDSLGVSRCSQREEWARCLQEIPRKIHEGLRESSLIAEAPALRSLLAALSAEPGSAVKIAGLSSSQKREGEIGLRARLAALSAFRERLALLEEAQSKSHTLKEAFSSREDAIEALAKAAPFTCTRGFLSVAPKDPSRAVEQVAGICGYACPAHHQGRLQADDTPEKLLADCPLSYYGLSSGQEIFLTKRNFVALRILNDLARSLEAAKASSRDPLAALLAPTVAKLAKELAALRFPAALSLSASPTPPPLESAALYPVASAPYLTLSATRVGVALWPTFGIQGKSATLLEGEFLHPGKAIPAPHDAVSLKEALDAAEAAEEALPGRIPSRARPPASSQSLPASQSAEGQRDPGRSLFVLADKDVAAETLFSVAWAASQAEYGRLMLVSGGRHLSGTLAPALEVWPVRGEDLAYPALSPRGFPGGALIVLLQKEGVRALLPPGLERSSLPPLALTGIKRDAAGQLSPVELSDFLRTFLPQKLILAVAPKTPMHELALVLDEIKRRAPKAQIAFTLAPEEGKPSWVRGLPRASQAAFFSLAPSAGFEFEPEPVTP